MPKFNTKTEPVVKTTTTHENGKGLTQKPESELIGILATGIQNTYYEKESEREIRLHQLIDTIAKKNKLFAAKALIYARTVFGQRSVTHIGAVDLLKHLSGDELGRKFFSKRDRKENRGGIIYRLDDMSEILACYLAKNGAEASIPNSLKKGFKDAIEHADAYQLAKYQMKGRSVSLVDIVNLVHPVQTPMNGNIKVTVAEYLKAIEGTKWAGKAAEQTKSNGDDSVEIPALHALMIGLLKQFDTVEDKNTEAGKVVAEKVKSGEITKEQAQKELVEAKTENYAELIKTKKIGYLALLRNIRNILKTNDAELLKQACNLLVEPAFIRKSLVWPHTIDLALEVMLIEFSGVQLKTVAAALNTAYELSIPNLNELLPEGRTAVVFDTSGSMGSSGCVNMPYNGKPKNINSSPAEKAALIAATFAKGTGGDVYHFASSCEQIKGWNPLDTINSLKQKFCGYNGRVGHGTMSSTILPELAKCGGKYDRILIISDEQCADSFVDSYKQYSNTYGAPYIYSINIAGYGATMMKENSRIFRLFGYSSDIYEKIKEVEINVDAVIDAINAIEI